MFLCCWLCAIPVKAVGDGNVDGGGGSMGQGSSQNVWSPGNDGVRVTVVPGRGQGAGHKAGRPDKQKTENRLLFREGM